MQIRASSIGEAWRELVSETVESDRTVRDDGMELQELLTVLVRIDAPLPPVEEDPFLRRNGDEELIEWMHDNFHAMDPVDGWGYSYGSRLYDFDGIDQIEAVKAKLESKPETKSATISTMNPPEDTTHVPCICTLDFKLRDGLILTAFFRSQDVGKKFGPDLLALNEIYEDVADHLDVPGNELVVHIASAHVYESDYDRVEAMLADSTA